jgi:hypothetical protein
VATRADLTFTKGRHWVLHLTAQDADGTAIDISGATISFRISTTAGVTTDTRTTSDGISITSGTDGEYTVTITPTNQTSSSIAASTNYKYEVQIVTAGGVYYDNLEGYLNVRPSLFT